jgi:hypothetical protein
MFGRQRPYRCPAELLPFKVYGELQVERIDPALFGTRIAMWVGNVWRFHGSSGFIGGTSGKKQGPTKGRN